MTLLPLVKITLCITYAAALYICIHCNLPLILWYPRLRRGITIPLFATEVTPVFQSEVDQVEGETNEHWHQGYRAHFERWQKCNHTTLLWDKLRRGRGNTSGFTTILCSVFLFFFSLKRFQDHREVYDQCCFYWKPKTSLTKMLNISNWIILKSQHWIWPSSVFYDIMAED